MEDLDGRWRRAHLHQLVHQVVRNAVVVRVKGDVIVNVHSGTGPFAQVEPLGWERTQCGLVYRRELGRSGPLALAEWPLVDPVAQFPDSLVQLLNREEPPMPQRGDDPALGQLHTRFDLRLVTRLVWPRRNHSDAVMYGHLLIGRIQVGIVATGFDHA